MFSLSRVCDVSILVHLQPCTSHRKLPKTLRVFLKTVAMCVQRPFLGVRTSKSLLALSKWISSDIVSSLPVMQVLDALLDLERIVFIRLEAHLSFYDRLIVDNWYRLRESSLGNIFVIRSYISALLAESKTADDDLFTSSISNLDPMHISDPIDYVKNIFSHSNLIGSNPEWFLRVEGHESKGSFRKLLISCWEKFILDPTVLFNDNSNKSLFVVQLLTTNSGGKKRYFSLPCLLFLFSCFLYKFFSKYNTSNGLKQDVMYICSKYILKKMSIFFHPDLFIQCCLNLIYMTGCITSALNNREWYEDRAPLIVRRLNINHSEIICCFSLPDRWETLSIITSTLDVNSLVRHLSLLYNEEGRTSLFNSMNYFLEIGGLANNSLWQGWYASFNSLFSSFFIDRISVNYRPYALSSLSLISISNHILRHGIEESNISLLAESFSAIAKNNHLEPSFLMARCDNFFGRSKFIDFHQGSISANSFLLNKLEEFLTMPDISISSCQSDISSCKKVFITILQLLPFCEKGFFKFIQCFSICEWFLRNLFDLCGSDLKEKDTLLNMSSYECGEFIWKLIFATLQKDPNDQSWIIFKYIFCRRFSVLYLVYFLS